MADSSSDKRRKGARTKADPSTSGWAGTMPNQNIWLAGLGALAQAQADARTEGHKAFEMLVKQGMQMQAQSQELATRQWTEAAERLGAMTTQVTGGSPAWNRLGGIFEARVQKALGSLGLPSADDWSELNTRLDKLERAVAALQSSAGQAKPAKASRKGSAQASARTRAKTTARGKAKPESGGS